MNITVICVGKLKEKFYESACNEYSKRLKRYADVNVIECAEEKLPDQPSAGQIEKALEKESVQIFSKIPKNSAVIALCIEGEQQSSEDFSNLLEKAALQGKSKVTFVIGGSYGMHKSVKAAAWKRISFSKMTFPHHLMRVLLFEQIYRGFKITEGSAYHK